MTDTGRLTETTSWNGVKCAHGSYFIHFSMNFNTVIVKDVAVSDLSLGHVSEFCFTMNFLIVFFLSFEVVCVCVSVSFLCHSLAFFPSRKQKRVDINLYGVENHWMGPFLTLCL